MKRLLTALLALALSACAGNISVKQQIDRDDRVAFTALREFQKLETAAFVARAPWPTAQQHKDIGAALSKAYTLVIDVANAGLALKPGEGVSANVKAEAAQLTALVADVLSLAAQAPPKAHQAAVDAQAKTSALATTVGGK